MRIHTKIVQYGIGLFIVGALFSIVSTVYAADTWALPTATVNSATSRSSVGYSLGTPVSTKSTDAYPLGTPVGGSSGGATAAGVAAIAGIAPLVATNCLPPGPKTPFNPAGKDGMPCTAIGLTPGITIVGVCQVGLCRAVAVTSAQSIFSAFAKAALKSAASQLVSSLLGGGSSSYSNSYPSTYTGDSAVPNINFDGLGTNIDVLPTATNIPSDTTNLKYTQGTPVVVKTPLAPPVRPPTITQQFNRKPVQNTRITRNSGSGKRSGTAFSGVTFDATTTDTTRNLTIAELERAAQEARMRAALQNNSSGSVQDGSLRDYRTSGIYQPASVDTTDTQNIQTKKSWWSSIVHFVKNIFKGTNNTQQ